MRHASIILVTGASGHIGSRLCALLRAAGHEVLAADVRPNADERVERCDIRASDQIVRLFESRPIATVIHLAAVLPTAFRADPIAAAAVNVTGTIGLLREAAAHRVGRFVFGSSMSVYGSASTSRGLSERDPAAPDEPYGAAKLLVELVGQNLAAATGLDFVSLRIARVVGPGARNTASAWRSQMFQAAAEQPTIAIPFAPAARLSLVHVDDVALMLMALTQAGEIPRRIYNGPAEVWETRQLAEMISAASGVQVEMGEADGGPLADGTQFTRDFDFRLRGLVHYRSASRGLTNA